MCLLALNAPLWLTVRTDGKNNNKAIVQIKALSKTFVSLKQIATIPPTPASVSADGCGVRCRCDKEVPPVRSQALIAVKARHRAVTYRYCSSSGRTVKMEKSAPIQPLQGDWLILNNHRNTQLGFGKCTLRSQAPCRKGKKCTSKINYMALVPFPRPFSSTQAIRGTRGHWECVCECRSNTSRNSISSSQVAYIVLRCWYCEVETLERDKAAHLCRRCDPRVPDRYKSVHAGQHSSEQVNRASSNPSGGPQSARAQQRLLQMLTSANMNSLAFRKTKLVSQSYAGGCVCSSRCTIMYRLVPQTGQLVLTRCSSSCQSSDKCTFVQAR